IGEASTSLSVQSAQINLKGTPRRPLSDHYGVRVQFAYHKNQEPQGQTRDSYNWRKETTVRYLTQAIQTLKNEEFEGFEAYTAVLANYRDQLIHGDGPFAEYFEKFH